MAGPVPVFVTVNFAIVAKCEFSCNTNIEFDIHQDFNKSIFAMAMGKNLNNLDFYYFSGQNSSYDYEMFISGGVSAGILAREIARLCSLPRTSI